MSLPEQETHKTVEQSFKQRSYIKRFLPRSLLGRSLLILVTPILLIQIISTVVFLDNHWQKMLDRLAYAVTGEISILVHTIDEGASKDSIENMKRYVSQDLGLLMTFDKGGRLEGHELLHEYSIWESLVIDTLAEHMDMQLNKPYTIRADFRQKWVTVSIQLESGVLHVVLPERRLFSSSGYIFLIWMFSTSLLLFVVAVLFMRNQIRPIRRLAVAAEWFGRGRDMQRFKLEGATEVRQAGQAFLDMRRRIKRQVSQRTIMLAGVSHDLRTPLTRMKLQLEMMPENEDTQAMKADIIHMQKMIDGYLDFARGDEGEAITKTHLYEIADRIKQRFSANNTQIHWFIPEYIQLSLRPLSFERCLVNLISNACKYSENVWVKASISDDERVEIVVEDDGPGISEDLYEDVFKPFYRVDGARSEGTGGTGLGLSIAMDVVHNHGGRIWLDRSDQGGLKVSMRMPL